MKYLKLTIICLFCFLFLNSPVVASDDSEIINQLEIFQNKISQDHSFESEISESGGYFTKEGTPQVYVSVYFTKTEDLITGDYYESTKNGAGLYILRAEPNVIADDWIVYNPIAYAFCGEYRIIISSSISFDDQELTAKYKAQMDEYSYDYLADMINNSSLCGVKEISIFDDLEIEIVKITGDAEISKGGIDNFVTAKVGDVLVAGDYISTGFESKVEFSVKDIATLTVQELTLFSVSQLSYDGNLARTSINLRKGQIDSSVRPPLEIKASFEIVTPSATIGVRGTRFTTSVDEITLDTEVYVDEGSVSVINKSDGEEIIVNSGEIVTIYSTGNIPTQNNDDDKVTTTSGLNLNIFALGLLFICFIIFVISFILLIKKKYLLGILLLLFDFLLFIIFIVLIFIPAFTKNPISEDLGNTRYTVENEFSVDLGSEIQKIEFYKDLDNIFVACYKIDESTLFTDMCPQGSTEVFRISLFQTEDYDEILNNPIYADSFISLYQFEDGSGYILEWPNGGYPDAVENIDINYFQDIAESFQLEDL